MIYENNYYYAGTDAILYNVELDKIGFYLAYNYLSRISSNRNITEVGVNIVEQIPNGISRSYPVLTGSNQLPIIKSSHHSINSEFGIRIVSGNINNSGITITPNRVIPIRVVFKGLTPGSTYNIHSYYIEDGNTITFNECEVTTMLRSSNITYQCTEVIKAQSSITDAQVQALKNNLDKACEIYNSMTAFTKANIGRSGDGSFTATIDSSLIEGANSGMNFRPESGLSTCVHEMAHNLMYPYYPDDTSMVTKFMEFATYSENATWVWLGGHNYPVISSEQYNEVMNYFVAAACYVCRAAGGKV